MDKVSFTKQENEVRSDFRAKISAAESTEDVKKFFVQTITRLFDMVFDGKVRTEYEDIALDPGREEGFRLSERLRKNSRFEETWNSSDLSGILRRFAGTANNRMTHLEKKPEKTEAKMYNKL